MKPVYGLTWIVIILLSQCLVAEDDQQEIWFGVLKVDSIRLRLEIRVTKSPDGNYVGSMISLDQGNADLKLDRFQIDDDMMTFEIKRIQATFEGELEASGDVAEGTFIQFGRKTAMKFERRNKTAVPRHVESWQGTMKAGTQEFEFQLRVFETLDGQRTAVLDSFNENAPNIPIKLDESDGFKFELPSTQARYEGELDDDRQTIRGHWFQSGGKFELDFSSIPLAQTRFLQFKRPQTPRPPFDYEAVEVQIPSRTEPEVTLAGTLTVPKGEGPFPAAILISGSGPQDRDCTIFGHQSFLVIADHFARRGIAVLRYDERGIGESTGNFAEATSEDLAADVGDLLDWLTKEVRVDATRLHLIGHSEGGIIAPMVAAGRDDLASIILLAGPTVTGAKIVMNQTRGIAAHAGADESVLDAQDAMMERIIRQLQAGKLDAEFVDKVIEDAQSAMPEEKRNKFVMNAAARARLVGLDSPWFRFFLKYDPAPALRDAKCDVLIINGGEDLQVDPALNSPMAEKISADRTNGRFEVLLIPGLNHLFQECGDGSPAKYAQIEQTFSPIVLKKMVDWIAEPKG